MASTTSTPTTKTAVKEIVTDLGTFIRFFDDGTLDRPFQSPFVPPTLHDPHTGISSKDVLISHNPKVSARLYLPKLAKSGEQQHPAEKVPILVYFHGGAFLIESAFSQVFHGHFGTLVPQANVIVVSVEYRLAPEHLLPAAYDDCWVALQWVASHSTKNTTHTEPWLINHGDLNRVFIGGDSAGGNIAHNIAMRAGTEALPGDVKILGTILAHPHFQRSYPIGSGPEQNIVHTIWNLVYPDAPGGVDNPLVNPLAPDAPSLAKLGCSRILVLIAGKDKFRDIEISYCEALKKSGWQGRLELFEEEGEGHIYHLIKPETETANKLIKRLASFLQE